MQFLQCSNPPQCTIYTSPFHSFNQVLPPTFTCALDRTSVYVGEEARVTITMTQGQASTGDVWWWGNRDTLVCTTNGKSCTYNHKFIAEHLRAKPKVQVSYGKKVDEVVNGKTVEKWINSWTSVVVDCTDDLEVRADAFAPTFVTVKSMHTISFNANSSSNFHTFCFAGLGPS